MHVAVPTAAAPAGSSASAPSGSGSDAQIARLQAQLKQLQKQMKDLATDSTMDASAKDKTEYEESVKPFLTPFDALIGTGVVSGSTDQMHTVITVK